MPEYVTPGEEPKGERCVPMLYIGIDIDRNIGIPEVRHELERELISKFHVVQRRFYSTVREGPAINENFLFLIEIDEAEFWDSINRTVQSFKDWAKKSDDIGDVGKDVSITIESGDPEIIIREAEEGFVR